MITWLSEQDVTALLTMDQAIDSLERMFLAKEHGEAKNLVRRRIKHPQSLLNEMSGSWVQHTAGTKTYMVTPKGVRFVLTVFDEPTGALRAVLEADRLGQMRTGAASGVATRYLSRPESAHVALIGAGWQAQSQLEAVLRVRPIRSVRVWSRRRPSVEAFIAWARARFPAVSFDEGRDVKNCIEDADVIITVTSAHDPVLEGALLPTGVHLNLAGSNRAEHRELDGLGVQRANFVAVDDLEVARSEAGDLILAEQEGRFDFTRAAELASVVAKRLPGRQAPDDVTIFSSQGMALEDLAVAEVVLKQAAERGIGLTLDRGQEAENNML